MSATLIRGGRVVSQDPAIGDLDNADVLVEGDRIAAVGPGLDAPAGAEVIEARDRIVMPGLVNAHIHTWQTGLRGLAGDWTATNYFRAMHAGLATFFRPEDIGIANLFGALNQIDGGVTTMVDWHHNNPTPDHSDAAIDGLEQSGVRAVFLHGSPKPDPKPGQTPYAEIPMPRAEVERLRNGRLSSDDALVTMGLAVLGPQMSVEEVTLTDFRLANELDIVASLHHSAEKMMAPEGYMAAAAQNLINGRINIVHGNELSDENLRILADHGATFCVTSEVEMQMCYTDPLSGRLGQLGVPFCVGSDIESAFGQDMFSVMRIPLQAERHLTQMRMKAESGERPHPTPLTTRDALRWGTLEGARAFRLDHKVGSLTPGKQADVVLLRADDMNIVGAHDPVHAIVMYAHPGNVDTVMIAGRVMKRGGRLLDQRITELAGRLKESGSRVLHDFRARSHTAEFA